MNIRDVHMWHVAFSRTKRALPLAQDLSVVLGMQNVWNACLLLAAFHREVTANLWPTGRRWQWVLCSHPPQNRCTTDCL